MQRPKNIHDTPVVTADIAKKAPDFCGCAILFSDTTAVFMAPLGQDISDVDVDQIGMGVFGSATCHGPGSTC